MKLKTIKRLDLLICSGILMGLGLWGFKSANASKTAQHNIQNQYVMAKVIPDKISKKHNEQAYVGKASNHHLQYISVDRLNAKKHKSFYLTMFNHIYAHKLGGHIISTPSQLQKTMPKSTATMNESQMNRTLLEAKMIHSTYLSQIGQKHTLLQIVPIPKQKKKMVQALMNHHKSAMKSIIKSNRKQEAIQQKQMAQMRKAQMQQGGNQQGQPMPTQQ